MATLELESAYLSKIVGYFLNPFEDLHQHAWRKMAEYGSQELRVLAKVFEDASKLVQLSCCHLQLCAPSPK